MTNHKSSRRTGTSSLCVFGGKSSSSNYWDHGQDQGEAARQGASSWKTRLGTMRQQGGIREIHCSFLFPCGTKLVSFSRVVFVFSMVVLLETSLLHAQGKLGDPADLHRFLFILLIQCLERYRWRYLPDIYPISTVHMFFHKLYYHYWHSLITVTLSNSFFLIFSVHSGAVSTVCQSLLFNRWWYHGNRNLHAGFRVGD